jgi:hypothetical protein
MPKEIRQCAKWQCAKRDLAKRRSGPGKHSSACAGPATASLPGLLHICARKRPGKEAVPGPANAALRNNNGPNRHHHQPPPPLWCTEEGATISTPTPSCLSFPPATPPPPAPQQSVTCTPPHRFCFGLTAGPPPGDTAPRGKKNEAVREEQERAN